MKAFHLSAPLCVLLAAPLYGQSPRVCLVNLDGGDVRIRSFVSGPPSEVTGKVTVEVGGKEEERAVKIGVRFAREHIVTIGIKGVVGFIDGQRIEEAKLRELLAKETPVLIAPAEPTPALWKAIRKGALVLVSPVSPEGVAGPPR